MGSIRDLIPMETGIFPRTPFSHYLKGRAVNHTVAREIDQSALHALRKITTPEKSTEDQAFGTLWHTVCIEPGDVSDRYFVVEWQEGYSKEGFPKKNTKAGKAKWESLEAEAAGREIISASQWKDATAMRAAFLAKREAQDLVSGNVEGEVTIVWDDQQTGLRCKGRIDILKPDEERFGDLKSTRDASRGGFGRSAAQWDYLTQMEWYTRGLESLTGEAWGHVIAAQEKSRPYESAFYSFSREDLEIARAINDRRLRQIKEVWDKPEDKWLGYPDEIVELWVPQWVKNKAAGAYESEPQDTVIVEEWM